MTKKTDAQDDKTPPTEPAVAPSADAFEVLEFIALAAEPEPISVEESERVLYRYRGPGAISGIPPRDLTILDVERLTPDQLRAAIVAPPGGKALYEAV
jgi:hypothetical protein